jgi:hypothetical protein
MKKINLVLSVLLLGFFVVYFVSGRLGKGSSSVLYAAYTCASYDQSSCPSSSCVWGYYGGDNYMSCYPKGGNGTPVTPTSVPWDCRPTDPSYCTDYGNGYGETAGSSGVADVAMVCTKGTDGVYRWHPTWCPYGCSGGSCNGATDECTSTSVCVFKYGSNYVCSGGQCVHHPPNPTSPPSQPCTSVNGVCSTILNTCSPGTASGVGTTKVTSTGINNTWSCVGSCGGSNSPTCSSTKCTNQPVVNGACISAASLTNVTNHSLCVRGDEANVVVTEEKITWNCMGSTNTCAEGDGADALNCSSDVDQGNWFQIKDGNILTKGKVVNYPPLTCKGNGCTSSTVVNGAIFSKSNSSTSGVDQSVSKSDSGFNFKTFSYNQLKAGYFDKKGVGTTFAGNTDWVNIKDTLGVIFVDGDLKINSDLSTSNFVMIIAKGTITIDPNVNLFNGILVANKVVAAVADSSSTAAVNQLVVNGMIHGVSSVQFSRSLYPKSLNNTTPSVLVNYKPELLFMVPEELNKSFSQWKVN